MHPIDVSEAKISGLVSSCHKWFCSTYGAALFYASPKFRSGLKWPLAGWLSVPEPFDFYTEQPLKEDSSAIEVGVGPVVVIEAIYEHCKLLEEIGIQNVSARVLELSEQLIKKMKKSHPEAQLLSPRDEQNFAASVNTSILLFECKDPNQMAESLAAKGIYVTARGNGIRVAIHFFNNEADLDRLVENWSS